MEEFKQGDPGLPADIPKFQKVTQVAMRKMFTPFKCESREGTLEGKPGDFVVEDGHGGFYPVSAEFHAANYAPAEASEDSTKEICNHLLVLMRKLNQPTQAGELSSLVHAYATVTRDHTPATAMGNKTLHNSTVSGARVNVKDIVVVGNGDSFRLLCKASSEKEGWMKSTKAMQTPHGCMIQVTTQQRNSDGSYAVAEALAYAPGVKYVEDVGNPGGRLLTEL